MCADTRRPQPDRASLWSQCGARQDKTKILGATPRSPTRVPDGFRDSSGTETTGSDRVRRPPPRAPAPRERRATPDRKRVVQGKSVSVRGDLGGRCIIKKKIKSTAANSTYHHVRRQCPVIPSTSHSLHHTFLSYTTIRFL